MNRCLLSVVCLSLFFARPLQAHGQARLAESAFGSALPFRLSSGFLIQVEGRIGNQAHLKFILDTGATISMVDQRVAEKLKLDLNAAQSFNFDRNLQWKEATVPEVQLGPIRVSNVAVLVGDLARYSEFAGKSDAVIGMDLLQLRNVAIDFGTGKLIFDPAAPQAYLPGGDPMTKCLVVELQVQDRPVRLIVDTGLQGILLYEERLRKSVPALRTAGSIKNATMGGRVRVKQATLPDVVFGNKDRQIPVLLLPSPAADILPGIVGVVGIDVLQARRVYFDFSRKSLSWE